MHQTHDHWNKVFNHSISIHSWSQDIPRTTLAIIASLNLNKDASIIDMGAGDSKLVDHLLDLGYTNITVLDISINAIEASKKRLGEKGYSVKWIVANFLEFKPEDKYDLWIDRAAFHFLIDINSINQYSALAKRFIKDNGYLLLSTFSDQGPDKCSGLEIKQYGKRELTKIFEENFNRERCIIEDHFTQMNVKQNFIYCLFKRRSGGGVFHNQCEDEYTSYLDNIPNDAATSCDISIKNCCRG